MRAFISLFMLFGLMACDTTPMKPAPPPTHGDGNELLFQADTVNSPATLNKNYVILISIDGYRWDYNKTFAPAHLSKIQQSGVAAESMRPVYPSKTFPNHFTLVTGMTADHHGIVSNEFYDPARDAVYSLPDRTTVEDGTWYFGEPLWITAEKQGMRTASYFWVGSEADIQGAHPNYYYRYDDKVPYEARVDGVLKWLKLPAAQRPHFITLYFEGVDAAAHRFGTTSPEMRAAIQQVDAAIGRLKEGITATGLPVNVVVVSDHGMQDLDARKMIYLDQSPEAARLLSHFRALGRGPQMVLYLNKGEDSALIAETQKVLSQRARNFRVWRRDQLAHFSYSSTPRVGDLVVEPDAPFSVGLRAHAPGTTGANHGWDPVKFKSMHGIFYTEGPDFKEHTKIPTFDNVDVYPLLLKVLGLEQRVPVDGQLAPVANALRPPKTP